MRDATASGANKSFANDGGGGGGGGGDVIIRVC